MPSVYRSDLQRLARARLREAKLLLKAGKYAGAYYLAGYAVECALKACVAKLVKRYEFPDLPKAKQVWEHDLDKLLGVLGLKEEIKKDEPVYDNWLVVKEWSEQSRYFFPKQEEAKALYAAIAAKKDGVLAWIRQRW